MAHMVSASQKNLFTVDQPGDCNEDGIEDGHSHHENRNERPTLLGAGMLMGYALTEGNLGTTFRHRGELVWIVPSWQRSEREACGSVMKPAG